MKLALAILLNAALLAALLPWLRRQWDEVPIWARAALALGLGGRLLVGAWRGGHLANDALFISEHADWLTAQLRAAPARFWEPLLSNYVVWHGDQVMYYGMSNTLFMAKILAVLNLVSADSGWLNGVYLSLFSFVGCWRLARTLVRVLPHTPAAAGVVGFVVWPTVVFWAAGVAKEALLLSSGAWLLALFLEMFYGPEPATSGGQARRVAGLLALAYLHFCMRYFFAVPLLGVLVGLAVLAGGQRLGIVRSRWAQALVLAAVLAGGAWLAPEVSVAFRVNKFTNQVVRVYSHLEQASRGKPHITYPGLEPTGGSVLRHAPQAALNAITRPWLGESWAPGYVAQALENAALLALLALAAVAGWRGRGGRLPFALGLGLAVVCLALAVLLGLTTPNLGSLSRYRSELLPFLLLLLLQNDYAAAALRRLGLGALLPSETRHAENPARPLA